MITMNFKKNDDEPWRVSKISVSKRKLSWILFYFFTLKNVWMIAEPNKSFKDSLDKLSLYELDKLWMQSVDSLLKEIYEGIHQQIPHAISLGNPGEIVQRVWKVSSELILCKKSRWYFLGGFCTECSLEIALPEENFKECLVVFPKKKTPRK